MLIFSLSCYILYIPLLILVFPVYCQPSTDTLFHDNNESLNSGTTSPNFVQFLNWNFHSNQWKAIKHKTACLDHAGSWIYHETSPITSSNSCETPYHEGKCANASKTIGHHYEWTPKEECGFVNERFSTTQLCQMMNGGNILIVGDSLSDQFAISLIEAVADTGTKCTDSHGGVVVTCPSQPSFKIYFNRNDRIDTCSLINYDKKTHKARPDIHSVESLVDGFVGRCFIDDFYTWMNASLLILNRGAHYQPTDVVLRGLNETFLEIYKRKPNVSVIFRNTAHGHNDVYKVFNTTPLAKPEPAPIIYNYEKFQQQNYEVYHMLAHHFPQVMYLDIFTSTVLRKDMHRDDLHYCIPGPPSTWVQTLFYNTLRIMRDYATGVMK